MTFVHNRRISMRWIGCLLLFFSINLHSQEPLVLQRIEGEIILDGRMDEPAWDSIEPLPLVMHTPNFGAEPRHPTIIRVAYDDDYLYVAAKCYSPLEEIYATSYRRDFAAPNTDYLGIVLDTFNDNETALNFAVMPTGARLDYSVFDDAQGSSPLNISWNTFWDAEVVHTEDGWSAEMRIPFSSLRFQDEHGVVEMGMIVYRWFASNASMAIYPPIPPNWGFWSFIKPSQARKIILHDVYSRKPVYITPYALGGMEQAFRLNPTETAYLRDDDPTYNFGLDLKYGITSNLTLDLTINTDFAQVEADDQQVNLTRFSLFFPEKRLFFQERASVFNFGTSERPSIFNSSTGTTNQIFYSRRIGLHQGKPVRLLGGVRLVGRIGGWDVGVLNMQTARERDIIVDDRALPAENFGVLRLRRQIINPYSFIGTIATTRFTVDGQYNVAYGFDGVIRMFADDYLSFSWAQTVDNDVSYRISSIDNARFHTQWEKRSLGGFGYNMSVSRSGEEYNPEMGFILRRDYTRFGDRIFYGWFPGEFSPLQRHQIYLNSVVFLRNIDGKVESMEFGPSWEAILKSGDRINLKAFIFTEDLENTFELSDRASIPPGKYNFTNVSASYEKLAGKLRGILTATGGSFYDGNSVSFSINPTWIASRYIQLNAFYRYTRIRFPDREQQFDGHILRFKIDASLNTKLSAAAFIQFNNTIGAVIVNARIRYNPREGNDLYIVYNEGLNTDRYNSDVILPVTNNRTILIKYAYTLVY